MATSMTSAPGRANSAAAADDLFAGTAAAAPADAAEARVSGKIAKIIFHKPEEDFYIFAVQRTGTRLPSEQVTVRGYGVQLGIGRDVECSGVWEQNKNPRYKELQLKASTVMEVLPTNTEGMRRLLHQGYVKGIGPKMADALLAAFGDKLFDVAETKPELLYNVPGVGESRVTALVRAVREKRAVPRIMSYLAEIGLGPGLSHRVFRELGSGAVSLIKKDPYALTRVPMIGFATADKVARRIGIAPDSDSRIRAGMEAVLLKEADDKGSTAVARSRLVTEMDKLLTLKNEDGSVALKLAPERLDAVVQASLEDGKRISMREICGGVKAVSLNEYVRGEQSIARRVARLALSPPAADVGRFDLASPKFAHLDEDQRAAARMALKSTFSVITGRPGCGKTTVTRSIIDVVADSGLSFVMCAPTGRAAKRITEATGYPAATMHRVLGSKGAGVFTHNEDNPLPFDVVLMDELSMVDTYLADRMLRAIKPGTIVIGVGDADQLPSIGAGNVLSDLIRSDVVPVGTLRQIHRQAQGSSIILNAHHIINGQPPVANANVKDDFAIVECFSPEKQVETILDQYRKLRAEGFDAEDIQILTPMRKRTDLGANNLNKVMKELLNPADGKPSITRGKFENETVFSVGDRIMQVANNKELGIYNGDIGYIRAIDTKAGEVLCDFSGEEVTMEPSDLEDVDLAYATTIHKSQGSEFPAVIMPLAKGHSMMLDRNLLYTGVTRGKQKVVVAGDTYMLKKAVERADSAVRLTGLQDELAQEFERLKPKAANDEQVPAAPAKRAKVAF